MQTVDAEVDGSALSCLDYFLLYLLAHLCDNFLDACGVYSSVGDELMQRQTCYLAAHGVEAAENDSLGSIIDNDFNACSGLDGADVASFATDDASL